MKGVACRLLSSGARVISRSFIISDRPSKDCSCHDSFLARLGSTVPDLHLSVFGFYGTMTHVWTRYTGMEEAVVIFRPSSLSRSLLVVGYPSISNASNPCCLWLCRSAQSSIRRMSTTSRLLHVRKLGQIMDHVVSFEGGLGPLPAVQLHPISSLDCSLATACD